MSVAGSGRGQAMRSRSLDRQTADDQQFYSPAARAALRRRHFQLPSHRRFLIFIIFIIIIIQMMHCSESDVEM